jgi:hypothetical protein
MRAVAQQLVAPANLPSKVPEVSGLVISERSCAFKVRGDVRAR